MQVLESNIINNKNNLESGGYHESMNKIYDLYGDFHAFYTFFNSRFNGFNQTYFPQQPESLPPLLLELPHGPLEKTDETTKLEKLVSHLLLSPSDFKFEFEPGLREVFIVLGAESVNLQVLFNKANLGHLTCGDQEISAFESFLQKEHQALFSQIKETIEMAVEPFKSRMPRGLV